MEEQEEVKMITIPESDYDCLMFDSAFLMCLEEAGVEDWEGYSEAQDLLDDMLEEDE